MSNYREAFHTELKSLLKNLCKTFEDDTELMMITSSLMVALSDDPENEVIRQFRDTVIPYKDLIDARDSVFFYKVHVNTQYKLLSKLHLYWEQLSKEDQKVVWDYIQVLVVLANRVLVLV